MDNFIDERDFKILEADKYTFFVLTRIMTRNCELLLSNHGINMKYELAEYFMKRATEQGKKLSILKNMFAYDCPKLADESILTPVDGQLHLCTLDDLEAVTDFKESFHTELKLDMKDREGYLPMLYTDADYVASNACYVKLGYILRGKLCTIG